MMIGLIAAIAAVFGWGVGDFFIQKTARRLGVWKPLFFINIVTSIILFPLVMQQLPLLLHNTRAWFLLGTLTIVELITVGFYFTALRQGKMAAVEPIIGVELAITVGLSVAIAGEILSVTQFLLIAMVTIGIFFIAIRNWPQSGWTKKILEKGALIAGVAGVGMAATNFLIGYSSQQIAPLVPLFFSNFTEMIILGLVFWHQGELGSTAREIKTHFKIVVPQCLFDAMGWIGYSVAVAFMPISIAITITENYIVLGALLGVVVNKEKLRLHQYFGILLTISGVIILAAIS